MESKKRHTQALTHVYMNARAFQNQNLHVFHLQINFNFNFNFNLIYVRACVLLVYYCLNRTIAIKNNYAMLHADRMEYRTHFDTNTHKCMHSVSQLRSLTHSFNHSSTQLLLHHTILLSTKRKNCII